MDPARKVRVQIDLVRDAALIVLGPSGVIYTNQTGGVACRQPEEEGILVPFSGDPPLYEPEKELPARLRALLCNAQYLTDEMADRVDQELQADAFTACGRVDRQRLDDSHEAWVYVFVEDGSFAGFGDLTPCKAVLTWANSD